MVDPGISVQYGSGGSSFPWVTLLTGVVTALAALSGSWIGNANQARLQREKLAAEEEVRKRAALRAHGEEIVILVREWLDVFGKGLQDLQNDLLRGRIRQETSSQIEFGGKITRATMLTRIDFPDNVLVLETLLKCRREGNDILVQGREAKRSAERQIQADRIESHHVDLNKAQREFVVAVTESIRNRT